MQITLEVCCSHQHLCCNTRTCYPIIRHEGRGVDKTEKPSVKRSSFYSRASQYRLHLDAKHTDRVVCRSAAFLRPFRNASIFCSVRGVHCPIQTANVVAAPPAVGFQQEFAVCAGHTLACLPGNGLRICQRQTGWHDQMDTAWAPFALISQTCRISETSRGKLQHLSLLLPLCDHLESPELTPGLSACYTVGL